MPGKTFLLSILLFATCFLWAAEADRAVMVRDATLRVSPSGSGEKLGEMGEPFVFVHEGREIKLCCKDCQKDFKKDPTMSWKKKKKGLQSF